MALPTLHATRLVLRPFAPSDAADILRMAGDFAVADTTFAIPHPYLDGMAEAWMSRHEPQFADGNALTLAITEQSALRGAISLMEISAGHQAELGYWIGRDHWGRGFCTEAARAMLDYAFTTLALVRVHACHLTRNPASGRVMQKLGLQHEGRRTKHIHKWGRFDDLELYGIVKA